MGLTFCSLASGSSGNSYMIRYEDTILLVDVGISGKRIVEGLIGAQAQAQEVKGILLTHEHSDHVKSLKVIQKKCPQARIYANQGTYDQVAQQIQEGRQQLFTTGESFFIDHIQVTPVPLSHDAQEPVGYTFCAGGRKLSIFTDTGYVTPTIRQQVRGSHLIVLESNHDEHILQFCRYPYHIKRRILSDQGHLSNETAALFMCDLIREEEALPGFLLAHLSKENNTPEMALITARNVLLEQDAFRNRPETVADLLLEVLQREAPSRVFQV